MAVASRTRRLLRLAKLPVASEEDVGVRSKTACPAKKLATQISVQFDLSREFSVQKAMSDSHHPRNGQIPASVSLRCCGFRTVCRSRITLAKSATYPSNWQL